jgi:hypothetical protein
MKMHLKETKKKRKERRLRIKNRAGLPPEKKEKKNE